MDAQEKDPFLTVNEELGYPIFVGSQLQRDLSHFVRAQADRFIVLTDRHAAVSEYAHRATDGIAGRLAVVGVPLGERRKRLATVELVLDALLRKGADRHTLILGVGGGVAGDVFGFAAATFMRGAPYAHLATSLVAMADAAIGGKTGVDLAGGKNVAGVFNDPVGVFCPADALQTLPFRRIREGLAEIVKHGIIAGSELFDALENLAAHTFGKWPWPAVVTASVDVKATIVAQDRSERGVRAVLNLGHTFAHAIERASSFRISHGAAVAIGLRGAGLLALRTGRFSEREHLRVLALLALLQLPMCMPLAVRRVFEAMSADKKRLDGVLRFVLPNSIGDVDYGVEVPGDDVLYVLDRITRDPVEPEFR